MWKKSNFYTLNHGSLTQNDKYKFIIIGILYIRYTINLFEVRLLSLGSIIMDVSYACRLHSPTQVLLYRSLMALPSPPDNQLITFCNPNLHTAHNLLLNQTRNLNFVKDFKLNFLCYYTARFPFATWSLFSALTGCQRTTPVTQLHTSFKVKFNNVRSKCFGTTLQKKKKTQHLYLFLISTYMPNWINPNTQKFLRFKVYY